jgi:hypothetical protein
MNVVEKEALLREGFEGFTEELPSQLKITKSAVVSSSPKPPRSLISRDIRPLSAAEVRKFIGERSHALQEFVAPLEAEIRKAGRYRARSRRTGRGAFAKVANLVLEIVRKVAHRETGMFALDPNVPLLLSTLYAGSVESSIVAGLVRRAQAVIAQAEQEEREGLLHGVSPTYGATRSGIQTAVGQEYDIARELDELTMLLKWYVRRKMSLAGLEIDSLRRNEGHDGASVAFSDEEDALFGFEVLHDNQVFGAKGCFVTSGLRLVGHDSQPLWLRVSVRWNGGPVAVRPEWGSWTDPGGTASIEIVSESAPFCSLVPIRPQAQRLVIDDIRAFVPYAALDLPAGRCDVELCVSVIDNDGRELLSASRNESICVPRRELVLTNVPAPHSVGMWPHDVVSGDRISELRVSSGYKVVAGWERHTISVLFDLSLFMHAGESVLLECRFLDDRGEIVELSSLGIPYVASELNVPVESVSSYRYRRILHPRGAWAHYRNLCIDIPVEFLLLEAGTHNLTCEVVIVSADDRVLCGDMGLVTVQVLGEARQKEPSEAAREARDAAVPATMQPGHMIELESLEVDSSWQFSEEECVRVQATFCPKDASRQIVELAAGRVGELFAPYRAEISLEREDGHVLLQAFSDSLGMGFKPVTRGVCVEGHSGFSEHSVVANFRKDEVLGWSFGNENHRGLSKLRLFARVRALSLTGDVLLDETKEFFVKPLAEGGRQVVEVGSPIPRLVDIVAHTYVQTRRLSCRALLNVPAGRFLEEGMTIVCKLVSPDGSGEQIFKRRVVSPRTATWVRQQIGLTQLGIEFEHRLTVPPTSELKVEISLLSAYEEVLHTLRQSVRVAGILVDTQNTADSLEDMDARDRAESVSSSSLEEVEGRDGGRGRGLLSWLRRK